MRQRVTSRPPRIPIPRPRSRQPKAINMAMSTHPEGWTLNEMRMRGIDIRSSLEDFLASAGPPADGSGSDRLNLDQGWHGPRAGLLIHLNRVWNQGLGVREQGLRG